MKTAALKFTFGVVLLVLVCAGLQWVWNQRVSDKLKLEDGYILLTIFALVTLLVHLFLLRSLHAPGGTFVRSFMTSMLFKFVFYISVLAAFLVLSHDNKKALALHFLFYYFAFTILEVSALYNESHKKA